MNLHEMVFDLMPGIAAIYELGFIPEEDEICELTLELYATYESKGGDISTRLYTILPKDEKNLSLDNEIGLLKEEEIPKLLKAAKWLRNHAKRAGCDLENSDSDDILAAATSVLPPVFWKNSKFARPRFRLVK